MATVTEADHVIAIVRMGCGAETDRDGEANSCGVGEAENVLSSSDDDEMAVNVEVIIDSVWAGASNAVAVRGGAGDGDSVSVGVFVTKKDVDRVGGGTTEAEAVSVRVSGIEGVSRHGRIGSERISESTAGPIE